MDEERCRQKEALEEQQSLLRNNFIRQQVLERENGFLQQTIQRYQAQLCIVDQRAQSLEAQNARKRQEHVEERLQLQIEIRNLQEKLREATSHLPPTRKRTGRRSIHSFFFSSPFVTASIELSSELQQQEEKRKEMEALYLKTRDELHYHQQEWFGLPVSDVTNTQLRENTIQGTADSGTQAREYTTAIAAQKETRAGATTLPVSVRCPQA